MRSAYAVFAIVIAVFLGLTDTSWAAVATLIESCKLNGVEPYAYLADILERMVAGQPINRLAELLPWNWKTLYAPGLKPAAA